MMRRTLMPLALCVALLLVAMPVQAGKASGVEILDLIDPYIDFKIDNTEGGIITIEYYVEVTDGLAVNVYFVDQDGYDDFIDPQEANFTYYVSYSVQDTKDAKKDWTWNEAGDFYVIIEYGGDTDTESSEVIYTVI